MILGPTRRDVLRYGALAAVASMPAPALAWPAKPIRIIVTYPAGGLTDVFARAYGEYVSQKVGQPVAVENKAGAAGAIGAEVVKSSPADGYTLMFTNSTIMIMNKVLFKKLPYDPDKDWSRGSTPGICRPSSTRTCRRRTSPSSPPGRAIARCRSRPTAPAPMRMS